MPAPLKLTGSKWWSESWNPVHGCSWMSRGCDNCYARRFAKRLAGRGGYSHHQPFAVTCDMRRLDEPNHWRDGQRVFTCSMGDVFHDDVPADFQWRIWEVMGDSPQHTFYILTKRPELAVRALRKLPDPKYWPNVWLGVSVEDAHATHRLTHLAGFPPGRRFASFEPLLGRLHTLHDWYWDLLDWAIVGCETSGPRDRLVRPSFMREIVTAARHKNVPVFIKQVPVDGKACSDMTKWPARLRRRELPAMYTP